MPAACFVWHMIQLLSLHKALNLFSRASLTGRASPPFPSSSAALDTLQCISFGRSAAPMAAWQEPCLSFVNKGKTMLFFNHVAQKIRIYL